MYAMSFAFLPSAGLACVVRGERSDLGVGQHAGDAAHLLADIVAPTARLERLQLLLEVRALLAVQPRRTRRKSDRPMTRRARCDAAHRVAGRDQPVHAPVRWTRSFRARGKGIAQRCEMRGEV